MRTLDPGPGAPEQWSKECRCTGAGNGDQGCQALLLVEWSDLYLTMEGGDPRDVIRDPRTPETAEELLRWANDAVERGVSPLSLVDAMVCVTFQCHNCQAETDILRMPAEQIAKGFHLLPTKRERLQRLDRFRKE